ncbi:hypothetical protein C8P64_1101 [Christiangramia gaetbulicola]|uniref:Uncharacterized protein n=1 Tax=Christiangramia gaetbulicola TaxID=703340 RepID=A0A2T6AMR5_9FLAO|nr:hypothetical protein [Christiangramia gaetbulicola]PTX45111.1 hypothetical protein C8P64_1101 [Christiangramia gaetbulicola]
MKIKKSSFFSLFLLQVIFLTSATNAFAFTKVTPDLDSRQGEFLRTEQNTKAVIFEETVAEGNFRSSQENENDFFPQYLDLRFTEFESQVSSEEKVASTFQPNKRNLLKTQIFPFHFFW